MKNYLFITAAFLICLNAEGQRLTAYDLEVKIAMQPKTMEVRGTVRIDWQGADSVNLILWNDTDIRSINAEDGSPLEFTLDPGKRPSLYIPYGGQLTVHRPAGEPADGKVYFDYTCNMRDMAPGFGRCFEDRWLELGFYTGWYPVHMESRDFTSEVSVTIDGGMKINGSGITGGQGEQLTLSQPWPSGDIVIVGATTLRTDRVSDGDLEIEIASVDLGDDMIRSMFEEVGSAHRYFTELLGQQSGGFVKFAVPPGGPGSGYARGSFIRLMAGNEMDSSTAGGIAHEMAHFWFKDAPVTSWEDWLNESFAEYLRFRYLKDKTGAEAPPPYKIRDKDFDTWIELYEYTTRNAPPIYGVDREIPEAYAALYEYGALMLREFERLLGEAEFTGFLRKFLSENITSTRQFLLFARREYPEWVEPWFAEKLGLPDDFI